MLNLQDCNITTDDNYFEIRNCRDLEALNIRLDQNSSIKSLQKCVLNSITISINRDNYTTSSINQPPTISSAELERRKKITDRIEMEKFNCIADCANKYTAYNLYKQCICWIFK